MPAKHLMRAGLLGLAVAAVGLAPACCGVSHLPINFVGQKNLIVWDSATKTEHFTRIATFAGDAKAMGFLAPTPTKPELVVVDGNVFEDLDDLTPMVIPGRNPYEGMKSEGSVPAAGGVEVVQEVFVGGYKATTFLATDAVALSGYLKEYGFKISPDQREWVEHYVRKNWMITAFQVSLKNGEGGTQPIRMSFKTEKPFNPYYVPPDNLPKRGGALKVYFVADQIYQGFLEKDGASWAGIDFSIKLRPEDRSQIADRLKLSPDQIGVSLAVASGRFRADSRGEIIFASTGYAAKDLPKDFVRYGDYKAGRTPPPAQGTPVIPIVGAVAVVTLGGLVWRRRRR